MTDKLTPGHGSRASSSHSVGEPRIRRCHSGVDIGDINKVRRRRRRSSSDIQRELLREERELLKQKGALKEDLARLTDKVRKLRGAILARRRRESGARCQRVESAPADRSAGQSSDHSPGDHVDDMLDISFHFVLVSLVMILCLWGAVNLMRCATVFLLPELFLECAVISPQQTADGVGEGAILEWRSRTALAWQLLFGDQHPCLPVYLDCCAQS